MSQTDQTQWHEESSAPTLTGAHAPTRYRLRFAAEALARWPGSTPARRRDAAGAAVALAECAAGSGERTAGARCCRYCRQAPSARGRATRERQPLRRPSSNPFGLADVGNVCQPGLRRPGWRRRPGRLRRGAATAHCVLREHRHRRSPAFAARPPTPSAWPTLAGQRQPAFADLDGDGDLDAFVGEY